METITNKYDSVIDKCKSLQTTHTDQSAFIGANRQRIIDLESTVAAHSGLIDEIKPEIEQINNMCNDINLCNEREEGKIDVILRGLGKSPIPPDNQLNDTTLNTTSETTHNQIDENEPNSHDINSFSDHDDHGGLVGDDTDNINRSATSDPDIEKTELDLLVIGSSIMRDVDASRIESRSTTKALTICMPGARIEDVRKKITNLHHNHVIKNIIIHVGGNNLNKNTTHDPRLLSNEVIELLQHTTKIMPETKIHYSAILPRSSDNILPAIFHINRTVKEYCMTNNIKFIPHYLFHEYRVTNSQVHYRINRSLFIKDIIHPTPAGTSAIAKNFISSYRNYRKT